jgi:hypothetical protein
MHDPGSTEVIIDVDGAQICPAAAKRGRPCGATSWWRNLDNIAAHHANVLLELWLAGAPSERRYTVPPKIKRKLCSLAVAHVVELRRDEILRQRAHDGATALRTQGYGDMQIAEIMRRDEPQPIDFEAPDVKKVLKIVNWRAPPAVTLRRKAADRILRR